MQLLTWLRMVGSLIKHFHHGFGHAAVSINLAALLVSGISYRMFCPFFMLRLSLHTNKFCFVLRGSLKKAMYSIGGIRLREGVCVHGFQMIFSGYHLQQRCMSYIQEKPKY